METGFDEMLAQVRQAAGEEMVVHTRRCRLLDERLARQRATPYPYPYPYPSPYPTRTPTPTLNPYPYPYPYPYP